MKENPFEIYANNPKSELPKLDSTGVATHIEGYIRELAKKANLPEARLGFAERIEETRGSGSARVLTVSIDKESLCTFKITHTLGMDNKVGIGKPTFTGEEIHQAVEEGVARLI